MWTVVSNDPLTHAALVPGGMVLVTEWGMVFVAAPLLGYDQVLWIKDRAEQAKKDEEA